MTSEDLLCKELVNSSPPSHETQNIVTYLQYTLISGQEVASSFSNEAKNTTTYINISSLFHESVEA